MLKCQFSEQLNNYYFDKNSLKCWNLRTVHFRFLQNCTFSYYLFSKPVTEYNDLLLSRALPSFCKFRCRFRRSTVVPFSMVYRVNPSGAGPSSLVHIMPSLYKSCRSSFMSSSSSFGSNDWLDSSSKSANSKKSTKMAISLIRHFSNT